MSLANKLAKAYRVENGNGFRLKKYDPADTGDLREDDAKQHLERSVLHMEELQSKLYAQDRWSLLLIFQAMDAAGKDGAIKHVMSGVNPQGCEVHSFKAPSTEELNHDYLWRSAQHLPSRGMIGIFNRSYYEEVLVVRVHPEVLSNEKLPRQLAGKHLWQERFDDIRHFEKYLSRNGTVIRKFFLYLSKAEQKRRFLSRLDEPEKNWKFSAADVRERQYWDQYMTAYEEMIANTATKHSPWYVVPADNKWFTRLVVAAVIVETLESLNVKYPQVSAENRKSLQAARKALANEA